MTGTRPRLAVLLAVVVPLIPFLVLLLYSGRIRVNLGPGDWTVRLGGEGPARKTERQPSTRRTIIELGGVLATMGTSWRFITRGFDVELGPLGLRYEPGPDGTRTSTAAPGTADDRATATTERGDTPNEPSDRDTRTEESTPGDETQSDFETAYGRRAYGRPDYGG